MSCGKCGCNCDNCQCGGGSKCNKCGCNCSGKRGMCPVSFGMGVGVACGLFMMVCAWASWLWGNGSDMMAQNTHMYGFAPTFVGGLWGGLWGLIEGFIFGVIVVSVYNMCTRCCKWRCCKK